MNSTSILQMIIIDISRDLMKCPLYPGTKEPQICLLSKISALTDCNVSQLKADLHTGTHIDAPLHFLRDGIDVAGLNLHKFIGPCLVSEHWDSISADTPSILLLKNQSNRPLDLQTCEHMFKSGITTLGTDALSLTTVDSETVIHRYLLGKQMGIIENLDLSDVPEGNYFLVAAPIKISGAEASFCRAVLIKHVNIH